MPRQARIDYPGALHHIIVHGKADREIFHNQSDYEEFICRLESALIASSTPCYAWALMPDHLHLLLMTGKKPISKIMQSMLTSYAIYFNKRYQHCGHVYQNRYRDTLCDYDTYLLKLIRYIHLNPVRNGLIKNITELADYPWTGHSLIMSNQTQAWPKTTEILALFSNNYNKARANYQQFISDGIATEPDKEEEFNLDGGGLLRSNGGIWEVMKAKHYGKTLHGDERILGNSNFVKKVLEFNSS